jgi:riboflavin synthase alpha subunit
VHLEPALKIGSPLDGHLVQGHVSSRTRVLENRWVGRGRMLTLKIPAGEGGFLIPEGSVALDGVSLTISSLEEDRFSIQLIGETLKSTCLGMLNPGDRVNLETDMLLRCSNQKLGTSGNQKPNITEQQLLQWGYL